VLYRIHNRTGLTIHTSACASSPARALVDVPVELPAAAWEHTLSCGPGLRSLVGEGEGKIEVVDLSASVEISIAGVVLAAPASGEMIEIVPDVVVETLADPVEPEAIEPPKAATPAPQGKGKHRR
jgi:hypothetical protein